jgi:hypothetical protein
MIHVMVMMVVMMVMVLHRFGGHRRRARGGAGDCGLCEGVSGEAKRENGRGGKAPDHGGLSFWLGTQTGQGERSSRLLKKSVRLRKEGVGDGFFAWIGFIL